MAGFKMKPMVGLATTAALPANTTGVAIGGVTFSAGGTPSAANPFAMRGTGTSALLIDGVSATAAGNFVLIKDQANPAHNGIYKCLDPGGGTQWLLVRAAAWSASSYGNTYDAGYWTNQVTFPVKLGTANKGQWFYLDTPSPDPAIIDSTSLNFSAFPASPPANHGSSHVPGGSDPIPALEGSQVACSSNLVVGTSAADVAGLTYTTAAAGTFEVNVSLDVLSTTAGGVMVASLLVDGVAQSAQITVVEPTVGGRGAHEKSYRISGIGAGKVIKVQAIRVGGGYTIQATHSIMTIQRVA
jgi:hypothetical protein